MMKKTEFNLYCVNRYQKYKIVLTRYIQIWWLHSHHSLHFVDNPSSVSEKKNTDRALSQGIH